MFDGAPARRADVFKKIFAPPSSGVAFSIGIVSERLRPARARARVGGRERRRPRPSVQLLSAVRNICARHTSTRARARARVLERLSSRLC